MANKQIETQVTAVYGGCHSTVANEAKMKRPENCQDVIARNTTKTVQTGQNEDEPKEPCRKQ